MNEVFFKLKDVEKRKIKAITRKRGIECLIKPIAKKEQTIDDYDIFVDKNVEIIKATQEEGFSYDFGEPFVAKVLFLYNNSDFYEVVDLESYQNNIDADTLRCLIDHNDVLQVGTILELFDNIRYKIARIEKYRGLSDVPIYHIIRV